MKLWCTSCGDVMNPTSEGCCVRCGLRLIPLCSRCKQPKLNGFAHRCATGMTAASSEIVDLRVTLVEKEVEIVALRQVYAAADAVMNRFAGRSDSIPDAEVLGGLARALNEVEKLKR